MPGHQTIVDAQATVRDARGKYLADNGFSMAGYTEPTFTLPFLGRQIRVPNPPVRQAVIARHDLDMRVVDLRRRLGLPDDGIVTRAD